MTAKDSNASASAHGWSFQVNAAIILSMKFIKHLESLKVEGKYEDIEITTDKKRKIFIQSKSVVTPHDTANVLRNLKKSLKTLSCASKSCDYDYLIMTTNSPKPFNKNDSYIYFNKGYQYYGINELPLEYFNTLKKYIEMLAKDGIDISSFDINRFYLNVFSFYGDDYTTKHYVVLERIGEFLNMLGIRKTSKTELLGYWHDLLFENSTKKDIKIEISKNDFLWPIIVLESLVSGNDSVFDDYLDKDIEDVLCNYNSIFQKQTNRVDLILRITGDFSDYLRKTGGTRKKSSLKTFVNDNYKDYELLIFPLIESRVRGVVKELLNKLIITKIIELYSLIETFKEEVNLE